MKLPSGWKLYNVIFVAAFIVLGLFAAVASSALITKANAAEAHVSLGQSFNHTQLSTGSVGVDLGGVELSYQEVGDDIHILSVSKIIRPDWCIGTICYYQRIGVAYIPNTPLVGDTNFRLGIGIDYKMIFGFEYFHYSSAGIHQINYGLDGIALRVNLPLSLELTY